MSEYSPFADSDIAARMPMGTLVATELPDNCWALTVRHDDPRKVRRYLKSLEELTGPSRFLPDDGSPMDTNVCYVQPLETPGEKNSVELTVFCASRADRERFTRAMTEESWARRHRVAAGLGALALVVAGAAYVHADAQPQTAAPVHQAGAGNTLRQVPPPQTLLPSQTPLPSQVPSPTTTPQAPPHQTQPAAHATSFRIATFNTLGASHTDNPSGKDYGKMPRSAARAATAVDFIKRHRIDIAGLQEFQPPQRAVFMSKSELGSTYDIFPARPRYGHHFSENSIIWRQDKFKLLQSGKVVIPYFGGRPAYTPWVKLQAKATGQKFYVFNTHDPADIPQFPHDAKWRDKAARIHRRVFTKFLGFGLPVFATGDYNSADNRIRPQDEYFVGHDLAKLPLHIMTDGGKLLQDAVKHANVDHILVSKDIAVNDSHLFHGPKGMTDHLVAVVDAAIKKS